MKPWDVFISHATEDKAEFVTPLAVALRGAGYKVWYDEFELSWGDSLRQSIESGLANSQVGIVILSPSFFQKRWTNLELDGLLEREQFGQKVVLPVLHRIDSDEVRRRYPSLSARLALHSDRGVKIIVAELGKILQTTNNRPKLTENAYDKAIQRISELQKNGYKHLDLSNIGLAEMPKEIAALKDLESLDLSFNPIRTLPDDVADLHKLRSLTLCNDAFQQTEVFHLPRSICTLKNLEELYLNGLMLIELPREIGELKSLRVLYCGKRELRKHSRANTVEVTGWASYQLSSKTNLRELPDSISHLVFLEKLDLSGNAITSIPDGFQHLQNLRLLDLYQNKLQDPGVVRSLNRLEELVLAGNPVTIAKNFLANVREPKSILDQIT